MFKMFLILNNFNEIDSDDGISQDKLLSLTLTTEAGEEEGERETTTSLLPIFYPNTHKTYFPLV